MSITPDVMKEGISLHGLGFIQVQLEGGQRLHVWHPELPRRTCFEHSAIHDHRFSFRSYVMIGAMCNIEYWAEPSESGEYLTYLHEGPRSPNGGRPWTPDQRVNLYETSQADVRAGHNYLMRSYKFHKTVPLGDGRVATLMQKLDEGERGARSTCRFGVQPDDDFDRFQWSRTQLWEIVNDVLGRDPNV